MPRKAPSEDGQDGWAGHSGSRVRGGSPARRNPADKPSRRPDPDTGLAQRRRGTVGRCFPQPLGGLIAIVGAAFIGWGIWVGVPAAAALGALLLIGFVIDLIVLLVLSPPGGTPAAPVAAPNPVQVGQPVTLWLYAASRARPNSPGALMTQCTVRNPWFPEWLPADMTAVVSPGVLGATISLDAECRGLVPVGAARWSTGSPLRLWRMRQEAAGRAELTVWPETVPLTVPPPRPTVSTGQGPMKAHLDDTTLREYAPGDDLRRVHWRSLARTNTLLTRSEEPEPLYRSTGALQIPAGADDDAVELAVALLTSWAEAMLAAGHPFDLRLGAVTLHQPNRNRLLETMTSLDASGGLTPADDEADDGVLIAVAAGPAVGAGVGSAVSPAVGAAVGAAGPPTLAGLPSIARDQCTVIIGGQTGAPAPGGAPAPHGSGAPLGAGAQDGTGAVYGGGAPRGTDPPHGSGAFQWTGAPYGDGVRFGTGVPYGTDALYLAPDTPLDQAARLLEAVLNPPGALS